MEFECFLWTSSMNLGKSLSLTEPWFCLQNTRNIVCCVTRSIAYPTKTSNRPCSGPPGHTLDGELPQPPSCRRGAQGCRPRQGTETAFLLLVSAIHSSLALTSSRRVKGRLEHGTGPDA